MVIDSSVHPHVPVPSRRFGRTELAMPVFSCGGMRYQHAWQDKEAVDIPGDNQSNLAACIHRAVEAGIVHIETARGYGTSEMQLGPVLAGLPRDRLIVQTKIGPKDTGAEFLETFATSMRYLQLDHVDLLGIHGINTQELLEKTLQPGGTLEAAQRLVRDGRVRHLGFSTHGPRSTILAAIRTGAFSYVNLHWYYVFQHNAEAIDAAREHDLGVFIISPNDKGGLLYQPTDKLRNLCEPLTPMQFNDLFCLSRDDVHTLSLGASRPSDFDEHLAALQQYEHRQAVSREIAQRIDREMIAALGYDWWSGWADGLPPWHEVPGGINLREILRLWNFATALDMVAYAKMRYNLLGQGDHWFPGNNAATVDEAAVREALEGYRFADRIPGLLRDAHARFFEAPKQRLSAS
jgi:predicted aldo/keto reductase-like oxidoreductase